MREKTRSKSKQTGLDGKPLDAETRAMIEKELKNPKRWQKFADEPQSGKVERRRR